MKIVIKDAETGKKIIEFIPLANLERTYGINTSSIGRFESEVIFPISFFVVNNGNDYDVVWGRLIRDITDIISGEDCIEKNSIENLRKSIDNFCCSINSISDNAKEGSIEDTAIESGCYIFKDPEPNVVDINIRDSKFIIQLTDESFCYHHNEITMPKGYCIVVSNPSKC